MWNNDKPPPSHHHFNRWYVYHSQSWLVKMAWCFPLFFPQKTVFMGTKNQETMVNWVNSENIYICIAPWLFNVANWRITTLNRQIIKKTSINGPFSMAILNNHRVCIYIYMYVYWLVVWNFFLCFHVLGRTIPTDELIFFRGIEATNQISK